MLSTGVFKGVYREHGIYWQGHYTIDGTGYYPTIGDVRAAIDSIHANREAREQAEKAAKLATGAIRAERVGDSVTVHLPDGVRTMTIRQYRAEVFDLEEKYGREIVFA